MKIFPQNTLKVVCELGKMKDHLLQKGPLLLSSSRTRRRRLLVVCLLFLVFSLFVFELFSIFFDDEEKKNDDDVVASTSSSFFAMKKLGGGGFHHRVREDDDDSENDEIQRALAVQRSNRHARSSEVSSNVALEKTEEYAEKIEDIIEPYYRQVFGKFAKRLVSLDEKDSSKREEDLDEVDIGNPIIEDDALEQENRDLERVNTEEDNEPIPVESVKIKYKDKE